MHVCEILQTFCDVVSVAMEMKKESNQRNAKWRQFKLNAIQPFPFLECQVVGLVGTGFVNRYQTRPEGTGRTSQ